MSLTSTCENCTSAAHAETSVSHDRIRDALDHLLSHPGFKASARNKRFMRFVVEQKLAGNGDKIKAYVIAVDVFGRGADFDPATDPIVRIEATRLRTALDGYYASVGRDDEIRFALPKGSYVPTFGTHTDVPHAVHQHDDIMQTYDPATAAAFEVVPRAQQHQHPFDALRSMLMIAGVLGVSMILARTVNESGATTSEGAGAVPTLPGALGLGEQISSGLLLPSPSVPGLGSAAMSLSIAKALQKMAFPDSDV
jgi:hypothetical protein